MISISNICKKYEISTKKVLDFLITHNYFIFDDKNNRMLPGSKRLPVKHFISDTRMVFDELELIRFLAKTKYSFAFDITLFDKINSENNIPTLKKYLKQLSQSKLLFLDFEAKKGNYYEVSWAMNDESPTITYFADDVPISSSTYSKLKNMEANNISFEIVSRKTINKKLKQLVSEADYIVAHNANSECKLLSTNGIMPGKKKFICTAKLSYIMDASDNWKTLTECAGIQGCKVRHDLVHYSSEDVRICQQLFKSLSR